MQAINTQGADNLLRKKCNPNSHTQGLQEWAGTRDLILQLQQTASPQPPTHQAANCSDRDFQANISSACETCRLIGTNGWISEAPRKSMATHLCLSESLNKRMPAQLRVPLPPRPAMNPRRRLNVSVHFCVHTYTYRC